MTELKKPFEITKLDLESINVRNITHRGELDLAGTLIPCANLDDGTRVITQDGLFTTFNRPRKGEVRIKGLPSFIGAQNLLDFVTDEVKEKAIPIPYQHQNGRLAYGYNAELIPLLCDMYLRAREAKVLQTSQELIAKQAEILIRALAKTGIIALIDEATGAQYDREKDHLQKLLKAYVAEEFLKWQARFPKKFFEEIFRLHAWKYDPMSLKRPQYVGKFINKYVYEQLPQGVLDELKRKNPATDSGFRKKKHHQFLTEGIGVPHLEKHLLKLLTVMELSDNTQQFNNNFNRVFQPKKPVQLSLFEHEQNNGDAEDNKKTI